MKEKMQLMVVFMLLGVASPMNNEGKALMAIKGSFSNLVNMLLDWDDVHNNDFCSWRGVYCDNLTFSVVTLNLSNLNLGGEISPAVGDLRNLQSIDLQGNKLAGQIPDEIGNCASLVYLDFSNNLLYGDIPFSISKLKQLDTLNLKNNQLTGPLPATLTQIPNLKILDLAGNHLTGEIPRLLYWNEVLQYFGLRGNMLTGTLSSDMCQLTGLWYFDVRGNNLTGTIPESIGNCTSFEILYVFASHTNKYYSSIVTVLWTYVFLFYRDVSYNQITGEIPYNIGFLQVATLSLQGNRLTGMIPEVIGLMQALAVLDLSDNELVGPIPPILGNLSFTGKLYLHGNKLNGPIPSELGNMSRLSYLQLNDNQLVGSIPPELGKLEQLFELNLANNRLVGPIPSNISSCAALNQFNVHGNLLNGSIPLAFRNLGSLTYLNLSSNNFKGKIPAELGHIINLDKLDLSGNNFSGSIPLTLGDLEHLLIFDVSFNLLSGVIPTELGQLQNLNSLILNNNKLHGKIPDQLTNCFTLINLNVSFNNLSGIIPQMKNFSRFAPASFLGNPYLCGNWVGSICGPSLPKSKVFSKAVVICIVLGFITLLCMILIVVVKSKQQKEIVKGSSKQPEGSTKLVILHMDMAIHTFDDIMRVTENFNEKFIIGYGASSTVYKCTLKTSRPIAIKRLYNQYPHNLHEFETELETIGRIRHRNIVSLHGYALSSVGNLLFYDYMENGSLWDLLHVGTLKKVKLDWETRLKIAVGAAQGLAYLHHDCTPRIIHRDIKSSNILLDENFVAHLSDFGIAKSIPTSKTHASTYVLGTIGYIDPEYARTSRLNEKSDIYSFGIVLLELLTGKKAVDNEANLHQLILSKADDNTVMEAVDPEVTVTCMDLGHIRKTFKLALLCTKRNPLERPTMLEVSRVLLSLLPSMQVAKKLPSPDPSKKPTDYGVREDQQRQMQERSEEGSQWFDQFHEVISKSSV
ncbi:unnamed protein product [Eruca vesicaria subsp. sativa]|uniref:non-specific serine/threonine protein kinase n=1 Tax=Eruca vesicaria subsp. sativa TaxID=29727 RepID=A0ABC8K8X0_ERUVS|nr:unnamed protein product [Eruca vesicaria subsp. sativa]